MTIEGLFSACNLLAMAGWILFCYRRAAGSR